MKAINGMCASDGLISGILTRASGLDSTSDLPIEFDIKTKVDGVSRGYSIGFSGSNVSTSIDHTSAFPRDLI